MVLEEDVVVVTGMKIIGKKCGMHFRVELNVRRGEKRAVIRKFYFTNFKCEIPIGGVQQTR